MPRNSLTKPSNFSRTQHERRSRSSDQGCAGRRGSGGRLLGTLASWNMMLRRKNAASPARSPNPPSRKNRTGPCPLRRSYLPPMQPSAKAPQQSSPSPGDPGEESVQTQFSEARPHYDGLHSRGNQSRGVCSVAFGLIARCKCYEGCSSGVGLGNCWLPTIGNPDRSPE